MKLTTPSHPDRLDTPITLRIGERDRVFTTRQGVIDALRSLERQEVSLNLQAARTSFYLGRALIEAKEKLGYGHLNWLYNEAGIHARRAQRCVKFAQRYARDDGSFDLDAYRHGEMLARNRHESGEDPCSFDAEDHPSVSAVMRADGIRSGRAKDAQNDPWVASDDTPAWRSPADALAELVGDGDGDEGDEGRLGRSHHAHHPRLESAQKGTSGAQLVIDFDLAASERRLAATVALAERAHRDGAISDAQARDINQTLEAAHARIARAIDGTHTS